MINAKKTRFYTFVINSGNDNPATLPKPLPIGEGKCVAVRLHLNLYKLYSIEEQNGGDPFRVYYGDANEQIVELFPLLDWGGRTSINNRSSELILCENLNEVWVKAWTNNGGTYIAIQVMVYYDPDDN